jgi:O-antigen biosynthesis protein
MKLSIIIVNYNVKYFLEQCLYSVRKASKGIELELIVVDNNSVDGSVEMLKDKFKDIILIENRKNTGFSVANNQGIEIAKGEYILLLNPDTVVQEDTFQKIIQFMDEHPEAGGLGVKMIDGKGNFLPESKRGLPTPMVAFFKIFGLARLFPKSRLFGKYHLGYLSNDEVHEVDVLAGAFMLMRKTVLEKVGLLDETFFMYGEDIDLSYRIQLGGYKNYYYPHTSIIHYKGESTKKSSVNYVFVFYNAMIIFAKKHFSKNNAKLFSFLINIAVYVRAGFAIFSRMINRLVLPFLDASTWYIGLYIIKLYWEHNHRYVRKAYAPELMQVAVPSYILAWLFSVWLMGGYDKPYKLSRLARGLFVGSLIIACTYAFVNEDWRFSRAIIILGAFWTVISSLSLRLILNLIGLKNYKLDGISSEKNIVIVATQEEGKRVLETIKQAIGKINFIGFVHPDKVYQEQNDEYLGNIIQLGEIAEVYRIDEVIFSTKNLPLHEIIHSMAMVKNTHVDYKIAPEESLFIIGSNSVDNPGDLYTIDINFNINKPQQSRNKQILDFAISLALIISFPVQIFLVKHPLQLLLNCWDVLCMRKSWVGYINTTIDNRHLPSIKKGIIHPADGLKKNLALDEHTSKRLNLLYAKHYQLSKDLVLIWRAYNKLGRKYGSTEQ